MNARPVATNKYDAVIIGGSIGGLTAASYLARGDARILVAERGEHFGGRAERIELGRGFRAPLPQSTSALDLRVLRDLHLHRHGLRYDKRHGNLIALRPGGKHIRLSHALSYTLFAADGRGGLAYAAFHREALRWARRLRRLWN